MSKEIALYMVFVILPITIFCLGMIDDLIERKEYKGIIAVLFLWIGIIVLPLIYRT